MAGANVKHKPLPVDKSFFDRVIEGGAYYVDKTLFIRDLIDRDAEAVLCIRPRRFGKTLNQTMLKCFFEDTTQIGGKDTRALFSGLKIEEAGERYMEYQGKYPVIYLSLKDAKLGRFDLSYNRLKDFIAEEFKRHSYAVEKISDNGNLEMFKRLSAGIGSIGDYSYALKFLSECLANYHGRKVVILIDEYDVPLENSWSRGFYQEMIDFIRPLLSSAFKDNPHLQLAVMTGCLRISKESIFTGLNNLAVVSVLSDFYSEHFGFTQDEMDAMLEYYGLENKTQIIKDWYNGYLFGNTVVYNPLSSICVVNAWTKNINRNPEPYWANTSGNDIVRKLVDTANAEMKTDLETLMAGGKISKTVHEDVTYEEIGKGKEKRNDNFWNFLFFTGYLKKVGDGRQNEDGELILDLSIPNLELRYIYKTKIQEWFRENMAKKDLDTFFRAILNGDADTFQNELSKLLLESISFMDNAENFYHGFMAGALSMLGGYVVKSNRESGDGRSDLVLYSAECMDDKAVIFELKSAKEFDALPTVCEEALKQIEEKNYAAYWDKEGYKSIIKYGVGFYKKRCKVLKG
jgi:hypothetical protein